MVVQPFWSDCDCDPHVCVHCAGGEGGGGGGVNDSYLPSKESQTFSRLDKECLSRLTCN